MVSEAKEKILHIFSDFMTSITKFDELVPVGSRLLVGFQQGLDFLQRPPIKKTTSELVERIIEANETKRVLSYFEAGCVNTHDSVQNISKLHTCQLGLYDHLSKAKCILNELKCLVEDAQQTVAESIPHLKDEDSGDESDPKATNSGMKLDVADYAVLIGIIYSMLKQDYTMQERIVASLNLKSSSSELESYCLMWSLRPFMDDEILHKAWRFIT
ncbi:uncharacterized protein LOC132284357 isoform X2 [Cornus florida]|uniref:uncharacterized protein LOC132284357 isoform X2 n=1 Tax=Cornus florida TaxID=4283 RepID=UPI00289F273C|nr:uncharacterized protein LOC132284357 isoform X2 [Cornus florida]